MEQSGNAGALKLAERILSQAKAAAEATAAQAKAALDAEKAELDKRREELQADFSKKREEAVAGVLDGAKTRAAIDGRKAALARRREVIEKAFAAAYEAMLALPEEARQKILLGVVKAEAEGGETLQPAKRDRAIVDAIVKALPEKKLTLSEEDAACESGCVILGESYEKDCSFAAILSEVREREETAVSKLLFQ